jgi:hypothetical protein
VDDFLDLGGVVDDAMELRDACDGEGVDAKRGDDYAEWIHLQMSRLRCPSDSDTG